MTEIEVQLVLKTEFGEYQGKRHIIDEDNLQEFIKKARTYYSGGFELTLENDSYVIFSPEVVKRSILQINKNKIGAEENDN